MVGRLLTGSIVSCQMSRERCRVYFISITPRSPPLSARDVKQHPRPACITSHACPIYIHEWTNGVWNFISSTIWDEISCKLSLWWNQICMSRPRPPRTPRPRRASRLCSRFIGFINSVFALLFLLLLPSQLNVPTDRRWNEILFTWNDSLFLFTSPMLFRVVFSSENVSEWEGIFTNSSPGDLKKIKSNWCDSCFHSDVFNFLNHNILSQWTGFNL